MSEKPTSEKWPQCYVLSPNMEWVLTIQPSKGMKGAYDFTVTRDGWSLIEATFCPPDGRPLDEWISVAIREMRGDAFHHRFHAVVRQHAPDAPTYDACQGECPWVCSRVRVRDVCMNEWAFLVPREVRRTGCMLFLRHQGLASTVAP